MANPFCYVLLGTDDTGKAKDFYGKVFDWKLEPTPGMPGHTDVKVGEGTGGGIAKRSMPEAPTAWLPYVLVKDVDATVKRARDLGARVVQEKVAIPKMGAFAIFIDPTGAAIGVWENAS